MFKRILKYEKLMLISALMLVFGCADTVYEPVSNGAISGTVKDANTGELLSGTSITTNPATDAIVSDDQGNYFLKNVPEGEYLISASKSGYNKGSVQVTVTTDDTTQAIILLSESSTSENRAPNVPTLDSPDDGATNEHVSVTLSWTGSDPDGDSLYYDVYLYGNHESPRLLIADTYQDTITVDSLKFDSAYRWQVVSKDGNGGETYGKVWSFTTEPVPNNPIVFASSRDGNYNIFSTNPEDTTGLYTVRLTSDDFRDWWPRKNPTRSKIAFVSDSNIDPQIFTMNTDGSGVYQVTTVPVIGYHNYGIGFGWSPDGTKLIYSHYETLYTIDGNGTGLTTIATAPANRHFREVDWSPLGNRIVAETIGQWKYDSEIYLMDADGGNMTQLVGNVPGALGDPVFSPDGTKIAYYQDVSGFEAENGRMLNTHIIISNLAGTDTTDISMNKPAGTNDTNPRWSPDGTKIIFTHAPNDNSAPPSVWIMNVDGTNRKQFKSNATMADWQ